ncbi:hypothetical protein HK101_003115, partial [Irineochytrium annulatum]
MPSDYGLNLRSSPPPDAPSPLNTPTSAPSAAAADATDRRASATRTPSPDPIDLVDMYLDDEPVSDGRGTVGVVGLMPDAGRGANAREAAHLDAVDGGSRTSSLYSWETPEDADDGLERAWLEKPARLSYISRNRESTDNSSTGSLSSSSTSFEKLQPSPISVSVMSPSPKPRTAPGSPDSYEANTPTGRGAVVTGNPLLLKRRWPSAVVARIVMALMESAAEGLPVDTSISESETPSRALVSTVLHPSASLPYAAFVKELHLTSRLGEALYLGDLHIAFQLFPNLSSFRIDSSPSTTNVLIQSLSDNCANLRNLSLRGCPITDALIPALASGCPELEHLDLSHTLVTVATLVTAVDLCQRLLSLRLEGAATSSSSLTWDPQHIHLRPLRLLDIRNSGLTDAHVRHAATHCPSLAAAFLGGSASLTDGGVLAIAQRCAHLEVLDLSLCPGLTDISLRALATLHPSGAGKSKLRSISVSGCDGVTPDGVACLAAECAPARLEEIVMHACGRVLGTWVERFAERRFELDCVVRGRNVALLAGAAARGGGWP